MNHKKQYPDISCFSYKYKSLFFVFLILLFFQTGILHSQKSGKESFSTIILPDPHFITKKFKAIYYKQLEWLIEHKEEKNIQFAIQMGDSTNHFTNTRSRTVAYVRERLKASGIHLFPTPVFQGSIGRSIASHKIDIGAEESDKEPDSEPDTGWTSIEVYRVKNHAYLSLIHKKTGILRIHRIENNGTIGNEIFYTNMGPGWSSAIPYTVKGTPYLFVSNKSRGHNKIFKIYDDGTPKDLIMTHSWNSDWNNARFFNSQGDTYLFFFMEKYSHVAIFRMNPDGTIGTKVDTYRWFPKFTHVRFYQTRERTFLLLFSADTGDIFIYNMKPWGKIGDKVSERNIGPGWKTVEPYNIAGNAYFLFLHKSGKIHIHRMNPNKIDNKSITYVCIEPVMDADGFFSIPSGGSGDIGDRLAEYTWNEGYSLINHYTVGTHHYILSYHPENNELSIHPVLTPENIERLYKTNKKFFLQTSIPSLFNYSIYHGSE